MAIFSAWKRTILVAIALAVAVAISITGQSGKWYKSLLLAEVPESVASIPLDESAGIIANEKTRLTHGFFKRIETGFGFTPRWKPCALESEAGCPAWVQGKFGKGIKLGNKNAIAFDTPLINEQLITHSFSFWIFLEKDLEVFEGTQTIMQIFGPQAGVVLDTASTLRGDVSSSPLEALYINRTEGIIFAYKSVMGEGERVSAYPLGKIPIGEWVHIAGVAKQKIVSGTPNGYMNIQFYINGQKVNRVITPRQAKSKTTFEWQTEGNMILGATSDLHIRGSGFQGVLDNIQIYKGALTDEDIQTLGRQNELGSSSFIAPDRTATPYVASQDLILYVPFDEAIGEQPLVLPSQKTGIRYGKTALQWVSGQFGNAVKLNKSSVQISDPGITLPYGGLTVSAWIKTTDGVQSERYNRGIVEKTTASRWSKGGFTLTITSGGAPQFLIADIYGGSAWVDATENIADDQWHLLTGVFETNPPGSWPVGKIKLYIDGKQKASQPSYIYLGDAGMPFLIGSKDTPNDGIIGTIDDVRVFKRALNDVEIRSLGGVYFPIQEASLSIAADIAPNSFKRFTPSTGLQTKGLQSIDIQVNANIPQNQATITINEYATVPPNIPLPKINNKEVPVLRSYRFEAPFSQNITEAVIVQTITKRALDQAGITDKNAVVLGRYHQGKWQAIAPESVVEDPATGIITYTFKSRGFSEFILTTNFPSDIEPSQDPVISYAFEDNGGTIATDSSINRNNAMLYNGPSWETGRFGKGITLNGQNAYLGLPLPTVVQTPHLSISAWVKLGSTTQNMMLINLEPRGAPLSKTGVHIGIIQGRPYFNKGDGNGLWQGITSSSVISDTTSWHLITATYDGATMKLYLDGKQVAFAANSTGISWQALPSGTNYPDPGQLFISAIKRNEIGVGPTIPDNSFFNGTVDEVTIWNRALSVAEISELMQYCGNLRVDDAKGEQCDGTAGLSNPETQICTNTCTIQSKIIPGQIIIKKTTIPDNVVQEFRFTASGEEMTDFTLDTDLATANVEAQKNFISINPGQYTVTETTSDDVYRLKSIDCQDASGGTNGDIANKKAVISLAEGETVQCTFVSEQTQQCGDGDIDAGEACDNLNRTKCAAQCTIPPKKEIPIVKPASAKTGDTIYVRFEVKKNTNP